MKISAIRLKEVGRFRDPIALERLSGGLDVLAGPNEAGKSTILKALKLALRSKHTSKTQDIEALRPYAGGAPLIEIDFESDGTPWRLRKQFLASRSAELRDLRSGRTMRGADAESELDRLVGRNEEDRFALVWVDQGSSIAVPQVSDGAPLLAVLEAEAGSAAGCGSLRAVLKLLRAELAELVTSHAVPRPTGRYKAAIEEREALARQLVEAQSRLASAEARLDKLAAVRIELAQLSDPAAVANRHDTTKAAARAHAEAAAACEKYRHAHEAVVMHEERLVAVKAALEGVEGSLADLAKLQDAERRAGPDLESATEAQRAAQAKEEACLRRRDEIKAALAQVEAEQKSIELGARLREAEARLKKARAAAAEIDALTAALKDNAANESALGAVRRESQAIGALKARLSASAATVSIEYAAGAKSKIIVDGRALAEGELISAVRPLALKIPGIGTLTVAPGRSEGAEDAEADLAAHADTLSDLLHRIGAASLEEAEEKAAQRRALCDHITDASAQLKAQAPDGLRAVERVYADLETRVASCAAASSVQSKAEIESAAAEMAAKLTTAEAALMEAQRAHASTREAAITLRTRGEERRARIDVLAETLGDEAHRVTVRKAARAAVADAQAALNRAVREHAAWRDKAPDEARLDALRRAAEAADAAKADADRRLSESRAAEARIEGELVADRADEVEARVTELTEACTGAEARVAALRAEVAAGQLLACELEGAERAARDRYTVPIMTRLAPYLDLVFPEARARFGNGLALEAIERSGGSEDLARLSQGTQEQLAVLVRLGLARLMCETGEPAPLILDDALVYSDDVRIERMFSALKLAAQSHQVLVLTCRERTFAGLGGNRVEIEPWREG